MKNLKIILFLLTGLFFVIGCKVDGIDDNSTVNITPSSNISKIFDISTDNSGLVRITPTGNAVSSFTVNFGHGTGASSSANLNPGNSAYHVYPEGNYTVTVISYDLAGNATTNTYPLSVVYSAPTDLAITTNISGYNVQVSAKATNAAGGFLVYFGDVANEVGTLLSASQTLSHTYVAGTYTIKVVALSGGAATTVATKEIRIFNPYSLPVTYEDANQNYAVGGTFGGVDTAVITNPFPGGINTSAKVWKFTKNNGAASWAGTWTPLGTPDGTPINIDNGNKFKIMVYATETGKSLRFQLEDGSSNKPNIDIPITIANQWQELTFDFSGAGIAAGHMFNQYVVQYNLSADGTGEVLYIDNIQQTN